MEELKTYLLFTAAGPVLVLSTYDFARRPERLGELASKTAKKFIVFQLPVDTVKASYSAHFSHVLSDPRQTGDIKILDSDGQEIFKNIRFKDLSTPIYYDPE